MTVAELIEKLKKFDSNEIVYVKKGELCKAWDAHSVDAVIENEVEASFVWKAWGKLIIE
jgi:hypothetical protein